MLYLYMVIFLPTKRFKAHFYDGVSSAICSPRQQVERGVRLAVKLATSGGKHMDDTEISVASLIFQSGFIHIAFI